MWFVSNIIVFLKKWRRRNKTSQEETVNTDQNKKINQINHLGSIQERQKKAPGTKNYTLAGWPFGLGSELGQSSSLIRLCKAGGVGVKG